MKRKNTFVTLLGLLALLGVLSACGGGGGGDDDGGNSLPVAVDDSYTITINTSLSIGEPGVLHNDTDSDGDDLDVVLYFGPSYGKLLLNAETGAFVYTPNTNFTGKDTFIYWASDGSGDSNLATATISVKNPPSTYAGNLDQAWIRCVNAADIARHAWETSTKQEIIEVVGEVVAQLLDLYPNVPARIISECGDGSYADVQLQIDQSAGTFNGLIYFVNYCVNWEEPFALNGLVLFEGSAEKTTTEDIVNLRLEFNNVEKKLNNFTVSYAITQGTADYIVTIVGSNITENIEYNYVLRNGNSGKDYWFDDFQINIISVSEETPSEATFNGRFYDHDYGFVDIESEEPLIVPDIDMPTGVLWFYGKESKASLNFAAGGTLLEVDENSDGKIDCSTTEVFPVMP